MSTLCLVIVQSFAASMLIGLLLGTLIGLRFRFPKDWTAFMVTAAANIMAPFIGNDVIIFSLTQSNITIVMNYLLLGLLTPLNVIFIVRMVRESKKTK